MEKKLIHFFYIPFLGLGLYNGYRGERFLKNRIQIFKQFVLPALLNQSKKEFIIWISWRPEDKNNQIIKDFKNSLESIKGISVVFTFGGLCFWDDKYKDEEAKERLLASLRLTLPELKQYISEDCEWVVMTLQPSDDLYVYNLVERVYNSESLEKAVQFRRGYIMNYNTGELREYNPETTPPFYTILFKRETFLDPDKHFEYCGKVKSHEYLKDHLPVEFWEDRGFIVGTHGENISTYFKHPYAGGFIEGADKENVLLNFGIWGREKLNIKKGWRRKILHKLPFKWQRKIRYLFGEKLYARLYDFIRK